MIYTFGEIIAYLLRKNTVYKLAPNAKYEAFVETDIVSANLFPGGAVLGIIHKDNLPILHEAYRLLFKKLVVAGFLLGFLSVAFIYFLLNFIREESNLVYWSMLFIALFPFSKTGSSGIKPDKQLFGGEINAYLNQLYINPFFTSSIVTVLLIQVLRYFNILF
jgi:hypothetical protein